MIEMAEIIQLPLFYENEIDNDGNGGENGHALFPNNTVTSDSRGHLKDIRLANDKRVLYFRFTFQNTSTI